MLLASGRWAWHIASFVLAILGHRDSTDHDIGEVTSHYKTTLSDTSEHRQLSWSQHGQSAWLQMNTSSQDQELIPRIANAMQDLKFDLAQKEEIWMLHKDKLEQKKALLKEVLDRKFEQDWWLQKIADFVPALYIDVLKNPRNVLKDVMYEPLMKSLLPMSYRDMRDSIDMVGTLEIGSIVNTFRGRLLSAYELLKTRIKARKCADALKKADSFEEVHDTAFKGRDALFNAKSPLYDEKDRINLPWYFCHGDPPYREYEDECASDNEFFQGVMHISNLRAAVCKNPEHYKTDIEYVAYHLLDENHPSGSALGKGLTDEFHDIKNCWEGLQQLSRSLKGVGETLKASGVDSLGQVKEALTTVLKSESKALKSKVAFHPDVLTAQELLNLAGSLVVSTVPTGFHRPEAPVKFDGVLLTTFAKPEACKCTGHTSTKDGSGGSDCESIQEGRPWCYVKPSKCSDGVDSDQDVDGVLQQWSFMACEAPDESERPSVKELHLYQHSFNKDNLDEQAHWLEEIYADALGVRLDAVDNIADLFAERFPGFEPESHIFDRDGKEINEDPHEIGEERFPILVKVELPQHAEAPEEREPSMHERRHKLHSLPSEELHLYQHSFDKENFDEAHADWMKKVYADALRVPVGDFDDLLDLFEERFPGFEPESHEYDRDGNEINEDPHGIGEERFPILVKIKLPQYTKANNGSSVLHHTPSLISGNDELPRVHPASVEVSEHDRRPAAHSNHSERLLRSSSELPLSEHELSEYSEGLRDELLNEHAPPTPLVHVVPKRVMDDEDDPACVNVTQDILEKWCAHTDGDEEEPRLHLLQKDMCYDWGDYDQGWFAWSFPPCHGMDEDEEEFPIVQYDMCYDEPSRRFFFPTLGDNHRERPTCE